jgi:hypothetical protein
MSLSNAVSIAARATNWPAPGAAQMTETVSAGVNRTVPVTSQEEL